MTELKKRLAAFRSHTEAETLADFTRENCETFLNSGSWKPSTVASYRAALSNLGNYCTRRGWIEENPVEKIFPPRLDRGNPLCYTIEEANRLLATAAKFESTYRIGKKTTHGPGPDRWPPGLVAPDGTPADRD